MNKLLLVSIIAVLCPILMRSTILLTTIPVSSNQTTYLYGTKASAMKGKVERQNGDFMKFTGNATLQWKINVAVSGDYEIRICHGAKTAATNPTVSVSVGKNSLSYPITPTNGVWGEGSFERIPVKGALRLNRGEQLISMEIRDAMSSGEIMNFRSIELTPVSAKASVQANDKKAIEARAKSDWLANAGYGLMFHWTSQSVNPDGSQKSFEQAVNDFDVSAFAEMVQSTGAKYVLFTIGHAEPYCPAPIASWEKIHPGHTTRRDLIAEMSKQLDNYGITLMCYFPTHVVAKYKEVPENKFSDIINEVITEFGERYGKQVAGYWFDGWYQCFEEYPGFSFEKFFRSCKAGNPDRIIALNSWIYPAVTEWQEYWAGETASPVELPVNGTLQRGPGKGLRYQSLIIMEPYWVQEKAEMPDPRFNEEELTAYIRNCMKNGGAVTINMGIYQDGTVGEKALKVMKEVKKKIRTQATIYPTASKYSQELRAAVINNPPQHAKLLAGHFSTDSASEFMWQKNIDEEGAYEVILGYSVRTANNVVTISTENSKLTDSLDITSGVFDKSSEWYHFNCERKLLDGQLLLKKGLNHIKLNFNPADNKSQFVIYSLELLPLAKKKQALDDISRAVGSRPQMDWFSNMKYGVMFHWTAQSAPKSGNILPYQKAVSAFNVERFASMVERTGAEYVIFTGNHAEPHFPAPLGKWEKEFPGQTTRRDLIHEISVALKKRNIKFILYLATHIYAKQDKVTSKEFERLNVELITEIGEHYKEEIDGYWLDGFYQSTQTHPNFNFEHFYRAAKAGNPSRLLALNSWLYPVVTQWQDYWAGEVYTPSTIPETRIIEKGPGKGLPFHSLVVMEHDWVHEKINTKIPSPRLTAEQLIPYISACAGKGPVTINLGIYQDGTIGDEAMIEMDKIKKAFDR